MKNAATQETRMDGVTAITGASPLTSASQNTYLRPLGASPLVVALCATCGHGELDHTGGTHCRECHLVDADCLHDFTVAVEIRGEDEICPCNAEPFPCSYCKAGFPEVRERMLSALRAERILAAVRAHWAEEDERKRQVDAFRDHEGDELDEFVPPYRLGDDA